MDPDNEGITKLPSSLHELASGPPQTWKSKDLTNKAIYIGNKRSSAVAVEPVSGDVVRQFGGGVVQPLVVDIHAGSTPLLIPRTEYTLTIYNFTNQTQVLWNMTLAEYGTMSAPYRRGKFSVLSPIAHERGDDDGYGLRFIPRGKAKGSMGFIKRKLKSPPVAVYHWDESGVLYRQALEPSKPGDRQVGDDPAGTSGHAPGRGQGGHMLSEFSVEQAGNGPMYLDSGPAALEAGAGAGAGAGEYGGPRGMVPYVEPDQCWPGHRSYPACLRSKTFVYDPHAEAAYFPVAVVPTAAAGGGATAALDGPAPVLTFDNAVILITALLVLAGAAQLEFFNAVLGARGGASRKDKKNRKKKGNKGGDKAVGLSACALATRVLPPPLCLFFHRRRLPPSRTDRCRAVQCARGSARALHARGSALPHLPCCCAPTPVPHAGRRWAQLQAAVGRDDRV